MVRHKDEFVENKFLLGTAALQSVEEEMGHRLAAKDRAALPCHGSDEKCPELLWGQHCYFRG